MSFQIWSSQKPQVPSYQNKGWWGHFPIVLATLPDGELKLARIRRMSLQPLIRAQLYWLHHPRAKKTTFLSSPLVCKTYFRVWAVLGVFRLSTQRHPSTFYALTPSFHLQQVYLAEQNELQAPQSHERRQRQRLIFRAPWHVLGFAG